MDAPESTDKRGSAKPTRVIIIGAGWAGLIAAKTYLEIDPTINLTILDSQRTLGGTWSADRIYPGLVTDSPTGLFDYSDLPMRDVIGQKDFTEISAQKVYEYLTAYAQKFHIIDHLRTNTSVTNITRNKDGAAWDLHTQAGEVLTCDKLIIATGLTSQPNWPNVPRDEFTGPVMHFRDIGTRHTELTSEKVNRVTVYGGCKSSIEAVMLCLSAGKHVDWIIREDGASPGLIGVGTPILGLSPARFFGRWKNIWTPSIFEANRNSFIYKFFHSGSNRLGYWLTRRVWEKASHVSFTRDPYKTTSPNVEKVFPASRSALFFTATLSAIHPGHLGDTFVSELQKTDGLLTVHRATITSLTGKTVHLNDDTTIPNTDAVVFATSWDRSISNLFDPSIAPSLGLPIPSASEPPDQKEYWSILQTEADASVLQQLPILATAPPLPPHLESRIRDRRKSTPFRLYRHILPSSMAAANDRSLIFLGFVSSIQTALYDEISALWGISYLEDLLPPSTIPSTKREIDESIARVNAWCARRYPVRGETEQLAPVEINDCVDMLMRDLGLRAVRPKGWFGRVFGGWVGVREVFDPVRAQECRGVVQEVLRLAAGRGRLIRGLR